MKLSIFTPTNNPKYLLQTYGSLAWSQNETEEWEWVVVVNGGLSPAQLPREIRNDSRVKIRTSNLKNIGGLKRYACEQARGDVLIELDHDDLLMPGALTRIRQTFEEHRAGFVYSDVAVFHDADFSPTGYSNAHGWTQYPVYHYGEKFLATRAFEPSVRSICEVHYAPDHVRCWSRENYFKAGGHDERLLVADDHDLVCRSYISGDPFIHMSSCEYLYRLHPDNSVKKFNADIQRLQKENRDRHFNRLIESWLTRNGLSRRRLEDLPGFTGSPEVASSYLPLPWATGSIGCLEVREGLALVPKEHLAALFSEIYRVLTPDGWCCLAVPSTDGRNGFMPTHRSFWNEETLRCFTDRVFAKPWGSAYTGRFQLARARTVPDTKEMEQRKCLTLHADLLAIKGVVPGSTSI